jgi:Domain of unknown function (DUF397)
VATTLGDPHQPPGPGSVWIKSSHSYANGDCVEVATLPGGGIAVRNSRDRAGAVLRFTAGRWQVFLDGVRSGAAARQAG